MRHIIKVSGKTVYHKVMVGLSMMMVQFIRDASNKVQLNVEMLYSSNKMALTIREKCLRTKQMVRVFLSAIKCVMRVHG